MRTIDNELIKEVLDEMGLRPKYDKDEDDEVYFRYKLLNLYICTSEFWQGYIHILLPGIRRTKTDTERMCAFYVCNKLTRRYRNVKVWLNERMDILSASSEFFVNSKKGLKFALQEILDILVDANYSVHREMNNYISQAEEDREG